MIKLCTLEESALGTVWIVELAKRSRYSRISRVAALLLMVEVGWQFVQIALERNDGQTRMFCCNFIKLCFLVA